MWYNIIRIVFWGLMFLLIIYILNRHNIKNKKVNVSIFIAAIALFLLSGLIPIENLFITFSSPEKAFRYEYSGNVETVVDGKNTTLVIYSKKDTISHAFIPKEKNGWKLDSGFSSKEVAQKYVDNKRVVLLRYKDSSDYYLMVWSPFNPQATLDISDNRNSSFKSFSQNNDSINSLNVVYVSFIEDFSNDYEVVIDNELIKFDDVDLF